MSDNVIALNDFEIKSNKGTLSYLKGEQIQLGVDLNGNHLKCGK